MPAGGISGPRRLSSASMGSSDNPWVAAGPLSSIAGMSSSNNPSFSAGPHEGNASSKPVDVQSEKGSVESLIKTPDPKGTSAA